jgi:TonB family protein
MRVRVLVTMSVATAFSLAGCSDDSVLGRLVGRRPPVEVPALVTTDLPFKYPPGLYISQIQGDVTLRLFIDSLGAVVRESTRVAEPAKYALFDSAAVEGAAKLTFRPARRGEHRIPFAVLFPVKFRVPNGAPLPQDTGHVPVKP